VAGPAPRPQPLRLLLGTPVTLIGLLAVVVFGLWAATEAGYPMTTWAPGTLFLLALLALAGAALPLQWKAVPLLVRVAVACMAGFVAWSYLSILWASAQADAWEGANRTLLYLLVFALFALWRQRAGAAAVVLGAWTLVVSLLALVVLVRIANTGNPISFFVAGRLAEPAGYPNAAAATWLMALWPAVVLASRSEVAWWLRALFAGGAVLLADVALLSQSRGALFSVPIVVVLTFVLVPGRVRLLTAFVPVAGAVAVTVPLVLEVQDRLRQGEVAADVVGSVVAPILIAGIVAAVVVAAIGVGETLRPLSRRSAERAHRAGAVAGIVGAVAVVVAALAVAGNPIDRVGDAWSSFKRGYAEPTATQSRLTQGLGSNRYDFYRVGLGRFADHPVAGVGADNFAQDYLVHGRSQETPRYPHSLEIRTLSQTGIVGALLLLGAVGSALLAAARALRSRERLAGPVAAGATLAFAYWLVHGSADWFFEFAGLGAPAFAMLGLACALAPRPEKGGWGAGGPRTRLRTAGLIAGAVGTLLAAAALAAPWLAERNVRRAAQDWGDDAPAALARLDRAAALNRLSDRPDLVAGAILLQLGDLRTARERFAAALERNPRSAYATLQLGAIDSNLGSLAQARRLLERARALHPRDPVTAAALARVRAGRPVDIADLNRQVLDRARRITG